MVDRARRRGRRGHGRRAARVDGAGFFYEPSVVVNPAQDAEIVQREVFGPVVTVQRFADEDQALAWANDVRLRARGERVDARRRPRDAHGAGAAVRHACGSTTTSRSCREMPHGGFKQSGYGKDMSIYAIEAYTEIKHVMVKH